MRKLIWTAFLSVALLAQPLLATAEDIKIVALGASATEGEGVSESDAYPAQLERLLKADGYSVSVVNEGISGNTTRDLLDRFDRAVPDGTNIVILQPGTNDKKRTKRRTALSPTETKENVEQMLAKLKERNISAVLMGYPGKGGRKVAQAHSAVWYGRGHKGIPPSMIQADGVHLTKEGNAVVAKNMSVIIKKIIDETKK
jgi:acyl-CoA thioesterase-1